MNQIGKQGAARSFNERLILSVLQRQGASAGSEIARRTGLSAQAVSVILRRLVADGLLTRGKTVKGRVGKPSVPLAINPDGVLSYGLKIGRRGADLILMNIGGEIRARSQLRYDYPMPGPVFGFMRDSMRDIETGLEPGEEGRICGIGIAAPFELWNWHDLVHAPEAEFRVWEKTVFAAEVAAFSDLPVFTVNDATAACRAEHIFGGGRNFQNYAYVFVGTFVGGGVVLNHSVFEGRSGNAGAFGSLPVPGANGSERQLLDIASIHSLENRLRQAGLDPAALWAQPQDWSAFSDHVAPWLDQAALGLARACVAASAVIDFEAVLIDGALPDDVRNTLIGRVRDKMAALETRGLNLPRIEAGRIGAPARAIGAASGPVISQYFLDTHSRTATGI